MADEDDSIVLSPEPALPAKRRRVRRPMKAKKRTIMVGGKPQEVWVYTTGTLAQQLERTHQTIRFWERDGHIPTAMYRDSRGRRLLTEDQVKCIIFVFRSAPETGTANFTWADSTIPEDIRKLWDQMPEGVWTKSEPPPWKEYYDDEA